MPDSNLNVPMELDPVTGLTVTAITPTLNKSPKAYINRDISGDEAYMNDDGKQFFETSNTTQDIYNQQGFTRTVANGVARIGTGAVLKTLSGLGRVAGFVGGGIEGAVDNQFANAVDAFEQDTKDYFDVKHSEDYTSKSVWDKMNESQFWMDEGADGAAFLISAVGSGALMGMATKSLGFGTKLAQMISEGSTMAKEGTIGTEATSTVLRDFLKNGDKHAITLYNTAMESLTEAKGVNDKIIESLYDGKTINPNTGKPYTYDEAKQEGAKGAAETAILNAIVLLGPNAIQTEMFFGKAAIEKSAIKELFKKGSLEAPILPTIKDFAKNMGKNAGVSMFSEGWEENSQLAIQNYEQDKHILHTKDGYQKILSNMMENFSTNEGQESMFLGAAMGIFGGLKHGYSETKGEYKQAENIYKQMLMNTSLFEMAGQNMYEYDDEGRLIKENGQPKVDREKVKKAVAGITNALQLSEDKVSAMLNDDDIKSGYLNTQVLAQLTHSFLQNEGGEDALNTYLEFNKSKALNDAKGDNKATAELNEVFSTYEQKIPKMIAHYNAVSKGFGGLLLGENKALLSKAREDLIRVQFHEGIKLMSLQDAVEGLEKENSTIKVNSFAAQLEFGPEWERMQNNTKTIENLNTAIEKQKESLKDLYSFSKNEKEYADYIETIKIKEKADELRKKEEKAKEKTVKKEKEEVVPKEEPVQSFDDLLKEKGQPAPEIKPEVIIGETAPEEIPFSEQYSIDENELNTEKTLERTREKNEKIIKLKIENIIQKKGQLNNALREQISERNYIKKVLGIIENKSLPEIDKILKSIASYKKTINSKSAKNTKRGELTEKTISSLRTSIKNGMQGLNIVTNLLKSSKEQISEIETIIEDLDTQIVYYRSVLADSNFVDLSKTEILNKIDNIKKKQSVLEKLINRLKKSIGKIKEFLNGFVKNTNELIKNFEGFSKSNPDFKQLTTEELKVLIDKDTLSADDYAILNREYTLLEEKVIKGLEDVENLEKIKETEDKRLLDIQNKLIQYDRHIRYLTELLETELQNTYKELRAEKNEIKKELLKVDVTTDINAKKETDRLEMQANTDLVFSNSIKNMTDIEAVKEELKNKDYYQYGDYNTPFSANLKTIAEKRIQEIEKGKVETPPVAQDFMSTLNEASVPKPEVIEKPGKKILKGKVDQAEQEETRKLIEEQIKSSAIEETNPVQEVIKKEIEEATTPAPESLNPTQAKIEVVSDEAKEEIAEEAQEVNEPINKEIEKKVDEVRNTISETFPLFVWKYGRTNNYETLVWDEKENTVIKNGNGFANAIRTDITCTSLLNGKEAQFIIGKSTDGKEMLHITYNGHIVAFPQTGVSDELRSAIFKAIKDGKQVYGTFKFMFDVTNRNINNVVDKNNKQVFFNLDNLSKNTVSPLTMKQEENAPLVYAYIKGHGTDFKYKIIESNGVAKYANRIKQLQIDFDSRPADKNAVGQLFVLNVAPDGKLKPLKISTKNINENTANKIIDVLADKDLDLDEKQRIVGKVLFLGFTDFDTDNVEKNARRAEPYTNHKTGDELLKFVKQDNKQEVGWKNVNIPINAMTEAHKKTLKDFLLNSKFNIDEFELESGKQYTDIFGVTYPNYEAYLRSESDQYEGDTPDSSEYSQSKAILRTDIYNNNGGLYENFKDFRVVDIKIVEDNNLSQKDTKIVTETVEESPFKEDTRYNTVTTDINEELTESDIVSVTDTFPNDTTKKLLKEYKKELDETVYGFIKNNIKFVDENGNEC